MVLFPALVSCTEVGKDRVKDRKGKRKVAKEGKPKPREILAEKRFKEENTERKK